MNVYEVTLAHKETGEERTVTVEAGNIRAAQKMSEGGSWLVGSVRPSHVTGRDELVLCDRIALTLAVISSLLFFLLPFAVLYSGYVGIVTQGRRGTSAFTLSMGAAMVWYLLWLSSSDYL